MLKFFLRPIDAALLIFFRLIAGILLAWELIHEIQLGKLAHYAIPHYHFHYMFFSWLKPWPYWGMVIHYSVTIFAALAVAFNYHYRFYSKLLFAGYTLLFLCDQSDYINHMYLYCLITFWMMVLPLEERKNSHPAWMLYIFLFHMGLAYFYGGVAKLNEDWLNGTPMDIFLAARKTHVFAPLYGKSWAPYLFSYGGLFFDLLIVPLLLIPGTRLFAFGLSIVFHFSNVMMFGLSTFPWFSLLLTSMFFNPSWPRKIPIIRKFMPWNLEVAPVYHATKAGFALVAVYVCVQLLLPLRLHLYPGDPSWTEEGHMFSWRMMLRDKKGSVNFLVVNPEAGMENVDLSRYLTQSQVKKMVGKPDLILQFAHFLRREYERKWGADVSVYSSSQVSLNGRPGREMIQQGIDLGRQPRTVLPYRWIEPLETVRRETANTEN